MRDRKDPDKEWLKALLDAYFPCLSTSENAKVTENQPAEGARERQQA